MSFRRVFAVAGLIAAGAALAQAPVPADDATARPATPPVTTPAAADVAASRTPADQPAAATGTATTSPAAASANAAAMVPGDPKAGETKAAVCAACHGVDGNSSDPQYPKLAGQNEAYIARQLELFKSGQRVNPIMIGFASALSPQDMHDIGAYFATRAPLPGVADQQMVERGQQLYRGGDVAAAIPACMACHGPDGHGMAGAGYPHLAGQWTDYVAAKLKDWKNGTVWGDDAHAKIMPAIAARLSDADLAALSSYVEGLHSAEGAPAAAR